MGCKQSKPESDVEEQQEVQMGDAQNIKVNTGQEEVGSTGFNQIEGVENYGHDGEYDNEAGDSNEEET